MFTTAREIGGRRRTKVYASNNTAKSSKTSLLSVFTAGSAGSGDSNSTITQTSYDRSQHRKRRRTRTRRHRNSISPINDKNRSVDVFDFLVEKDGSKESLALVKQTTGDDVDASDEISENDFEDLDEQEEGDSSEEAEDPDETGESERCPDDHVGSRTEHDEENRENIAGDQAAEGDTDSDGEAAIPPAVIIHTEDAEPERYYRSMSDSGISMGNCSMDTSLASLPPRHSVPQEGPHSRPPSRSHTGNELAIIDPRWTWSTSPGPFHDGYIPPPAPVPPPIMYEVPPYPPYPPYTPYGTPPPMQEEEEPRGPAIKIREPSQQDIKPKCFRSFTKVSTRVMLQLQDDIAELDGELSVLDAELDAIEADSGSSDDEASTRPGTVKHMLKAREFEIYNELQFKLGQYASTLENMHKIESMSRPATKSDLTKHHRWLETRISPSFRARHLVSSDLRTFSKGDATDNATVSGHDTQFLAYVAIVNTLIPLLTFKLFNSVTTRLLLLIVIVISGVTVHDRTKSKIQSADINCIVACVGISFFAAFFY